MMLSLRRCALVLLAGFALAACTSTAKQAPPSEGAAEGAPQAQEGQRSMPVVPGRPGRVFIFSAVDKACATLPPPEVAITQPPIKGDLSFKAGQDTTIGSSAQGTCIGAKAKGTGVYYTARAGQTGLDAFTLTAKLATGETMTRQFTVTISE